MLAMIRLNCFRLSTITCSSSVCVDPMHSKLNSSKLLLNVRCARDKSRICVTTDETHQKTRHRLWVIGHYNRICSYTSYMKKQYHPIRFCKQAVMESWIGNPILIFSIVCSIRYHEERLISLYKIMEDAMFNALSSIMKNSYFLVCYTFCFECGELIE